MDVRITSISSEDHKSIINFYAKYGDQSYDWYIKKFKDDIILKKIIGEICIDKNTNEIVGAYLGRVQPLLSSPSLKAVQSIDTLISPNYRGGRVLINLANKFYKSLKEKSFDCIYGLPNQKIEKFRFKFLKWNYSAATYCYIVFIPIFLLKIFYFFIRLFIKNKIFSNYSLKKINLLKKILVINTNHNENLIHGTYWISSENSLFTDIGLCRTSRNLSTFSSLVILSILASTAQGFFLKTYSTKDTETGEVFRFFSIKKRALNFCGLNLKNEPKKIFNQKSFEFVEFDTFGLY
jgi:hypothetical protein